MLVPCARGYLSLQRGSDHMRKPFSVSLESAHTFCPSAKLVTLAPVLSPQSWVHFCHHDLAHTHTKIFRQYRATRLKSRKNPKTTHYDPRGHVSHTYYIVREYLSKPQPAKSSLCASTIPFQAFALHTGIFLSRDSDEHT